MIYLFSVCKKGLDNMKKFHLMKGAILGVYLLSIPPLCVKAEDEKTYFGYTKEELKNKASSVGQDIVDWCENVDNKINENIVDKAKEKVSEIELFSHDSLWLITDTKEDKERHFYFVNRNTPTIKTTTYFDKWNNPVSKNAVDAVKKREKEMFVSVSNIEEAFVMETYYDFINNRVTSNYVELNEDKTTFLENEGRYGRFVSFDFLLPSDKIKEKYSIEDLKEILELLNNPSYKISNGPHLSRK